MAQKEILGSAGRMSNIRLFPFTVIDDTTKEIVYRDYVDISVAVATPKVRQSGV